LVTSGAGLTIDGQPVVGGNGLRVVPSATDTPDVINGASVNAIDAGVQGSVIAGGGTTNFNGAVSANHIAADFSSVGGGSGNSIQSGSDPFLYRFGLEQFYWRWRVSISHRGRVV